MIVWLASYPRSGNMLTAQILYQCMGLRSYVDPSNAPTIDFPDMRAPSPKIRHSGLGGRHASRNQPFSPKLNYSVPWETFYRERYAAEGLHLVKTHAHPPDDSKALVVVRDGRKSIFSYYNMKQDVYGLIDMRLEDLILGHEGYGRWTDHTHAWLNQSPQSTLVLRFEQLVHVGAQDLEKIADFIEYRGPVQAWNNPFEEGRRRNPTYFREGKTTWERPAEWTDEVDWLFWRVHGETMAELGYGTSPYSCRSGPSEAYRQAMEERLLEPFTAQHAHLALSDYPPGRRRARSFSDRIARIPGIPGALGQYTLPGEPFEFEPLSGEGARIALMVSAHSDPVITLRTLESVLAQESADFKWFLEGSHRSRKLKQQLECLNSEIPGFEDCAETDWSKIERRWSAMGGEVRGWLKAPHRLLPGSLCEVARFFAQYPEVDVLYSHRLIQTRSGVELGRWLLPSHAHCWQQILPAIPEETVFWRAGLENEVGPIDDDHPFVMADFLLKCLKSGARFARHETFLTTFIHYEFLNCRDWLKKPGRSFRPLHPVGLLSYRLACYYYLRFRYEAPEPWSSEASTD